MRLLEQVGSGNFSLSDLIQDIPPYIILSYTWGVDSEDVTFRDIMSGTGKGKAGYAKVQFCGNQAAIDSLRYFWIDAYCID
jgi:hypothetical protein